MSSGGQYPNEEEWVAQERRKVIGIHLLEKLRRD